MGGVRSSVNQRPTPTSSVTPVIPEPTLSYHSDCNGWGRRDGEVGWWDGWGIISRFF